MVSAPPVSTGIPAMLTIGATATAATTTSVVVTEKIVASTTTVETVETAAAVKTAVAVKSAEAVKSLIATAETDKLTAKLTVAEQLRLKKSHLEAIEKQASFIKNRQEKLRSELRQLSKKYDKFMSSKAKLVNQIEILESL